MVTVHGARRSHGRAVGGAGAVVAEGVDGRAAVGLASAAADRRHTVQGPDGSPVAGRPRRVRTVEPGPRPVPPVAAQRHLASDPHPAPVPGRRGWCDHVGPGRRLHGLLRAHQHAAGARKQGDLRRGTTRWCVHRAGRSRPGTVARLPAPTRDPLHRSRGGRPGPQPPKTRLPWRPAAARRHGRLPRAPCGRVRDQPTQEEPCWSQRSTNGYDPVSRVITYMFPMSGSPYMKNSTSPSC